MGRSSSKKESKSSKTNSKIRIIYPNRASKASSKHDRDKIQSFFKGLLIIEAIQLNELNQQSLESGFLNRIPDKSIRG